MQNIEQLVVRLVQKNLDLEDKIHKISNESDGRKRQIEDLLRDYKICSEQRDENIELVEIGYAVSRLENLIIANPKLDYILSSGNNDGQYTVFIVNRENDKKMADSRELTINDAVEAAIVQAEELGYYEQVSKD